MMSDLNGVRATASSIAKIAPSPVAACLALLVAQATSAQTETKTHLLKVFLADFEDIPHPESYTREYFEQLMFGLDGPRVTPEGRPLSGSVREYFLNLSEGRIDVQGEVTDWIRIPRRITRIPHWKPGMTPFGESWPVIVAETLCRAGIVGEQATERVRLSDGRTPDLLVFLNTDWGVGGVNRGWGHLKDVLGKMGLSELWDEAWLKLPEPYSSYSATLWRKAPGSGPDGTINEVPRPSELELFPLSIMMHEMGHQLAGWPDLYGGAFEPWGVFDLMGGPAASTHFPMTVSAYLRVRSGWMQFTDAPYRTQHGLMVQPLDTHKEALRFPQGPGQESIIAENRWCLKYPGDYSRPPTNEGPRLLLYRMDPAGRRRMMYGENPVGKVTTMIRRPDHYGEVWGGEGFTEVTAETTPSSRNSLGELWWEFRNIRQASPDAVSLDADFRAHDLVREYCAAAWMDGDGARLEAGRYGGSGGYVSLCPLSGGETENSPALEIATAPGGRVRGRYGLPAGAPRRLYATVEPVAAGDAAAFVVAPSVGEATHLGLADASGARRTVIAELPAGADAVELIVQAPSATQRARLRLQAAWLVGLPETLTDLARTAPAASPEGPPLPSGTSVILRDGAAYGPATLSVPVGGDAPDARRLEWQVDLPQAPAVLRGLFGLPATAPPDGGVTVAVTLIAGEQTWALVQNLTIAGDSEDGWPAIIETTVPPEARGRTCRIVMDVSTKDRRAANLAVPYLCVTKG